MRKTVIATVLVVVAIAVSAILLQFPSLVGPPPQKRIREYTAVIVSNSTPEEIKATPYVTRFLFPSRDSGPRSIVTDKEGKVWIGEGGLPGLRSNVSILASYDPISKSLVEYRIPDISGSAQIWGMIVSPDGNVWFTEATSNSIWRFNQQNLTFTRYIIPTDNSFPLQLTFDRGGKLWFTEDLQDKIGVLDPSTGSIQEFGLPGVRPTPVGLAFDNQGKLWIAEAQPKKIALFDPSTRNFTEFQPPRPVILPTGITVDDEGGVWFTQHKATSTVSRFFPFNGTMIDYVTSSIGSKSDNITLPFWIIRDDAGYIWFNEHYANKIAKLDPRTGILSEYLISSPGVSDCIDLYSLPTGVCNVISFSLDAKGNAWFVEWSENRFGVVNSSAPPTFTLSTENRTTTIRSGSETTLTFSISTLQGGELRLDITSSTTPIGKLSGLSAQFSTSTISLPDGAREQVILKLAADETLKAGSYTLTVTASDEFHSQSVTVQLIVKPGT